MTSLPLTCNMPRNKLGPSLPQNQIKSEAEFAKKKDALRAEARKRCEAQYWSRSHVLSGSSSSSLYCGVSLTRIPLCLLQA